MKRTLIFVFVFAIGSLFLSAMSSKPTAETAQKTESAVVFITGDELGVLQPCGCTSGQFGGLDRRATVLKSVPESKRMVIGAGAIVEGDSEQDLIKFNIIIHAYGMLNYDLVNLSAKDIENVTNTGRTDMIGQIFNVISSQGGDLNMPATFTKKLSLKGKSISVTVGTFNSENQSIEQINGLFPCQEPLESVNILFVNNCDANTIESIAQADVHINCLICPADSEEPGKIVVDSNNPNLPELIISCGRFGEYVSRIDITSHPKSNKLKVGFSAIPLTEDLHRDQALVEWYKTYQQLVKDAGLLEKMPRFPLPNGLEYTGSKSCKICHEYEYAAWSKKVHANAYATLEKVGSQYDPECVVCHVVGLEYESGFVSEKQTVHLKNVGCENCHGPGSEHNRSLGEALTRDPKSQCVDCHTPDHSGEYAEKEKIYFQKIIHWVEPNTVDNVKSK